MTDQRKAGISPAVGDYAIQELARAKERIERLHSLVEQLAGRFKGYLPWPDPMRDSVVRGHEKFIEDTIRKADALAAGQGEVNEQAPGKD